MRNIVQCNGRTFTNDDIISGECHIARSLLSSSLEIETLEFEVYSTDTTLVNFEVDSQVVYIYNDVRIRTFFLQEVTREGKYRYAFKAISAAGVLDKRDYYGGIFSGQTVKEVVADICKSFPITVSANVAGIKLYGWLPISTRREALAQVLFAISATIKDDVNGRFTISGLSQEQTRVVSRDDTSDSAKVKYNTSAIDVVVIEHQYVEGTEEAKLFEGITSNGDVITFEEPCHSLVAKGFNITEQGANYAIVTSGSGTLTGKKYIHSTREVKGKRQTRDITVDNERNVRVEDATLVSLVNSRAVADRLADYYAQSERIVTDVSYGFDDAGDVLSQYHPYDDKMVQTCIESLDIKMSGQLIANMTSIVGYIPPDISQIEYFDKYEILTGTGSWKAPNGAKNARAILIGGGDGGTNGKDGESGGDGHELGNPDREGKGGKGGEPGTPGNGGKILQVEIDATQSYTYSVGAGGAIGQPGIATTFGLFSSDSGTSNDGGFTELISKVTYAKKGLPGVAGGDGGNAESNGKDVETWTGGLGGEGASEGGVSAKGGGGSGAAKGNNGKNGTSAFIRRTQGNYFPFGGNGARGADAITAEPQQEYGCGGSAGHGGGGGGGGGSASNNSLGNSGDDGSGGNGGNGSAGTAGNPGCIIVYYSLPKPVTP